MLQLHLSASPPSTAVHCTAGLLLPQVFQADHAPAVATPETAVDFMMSTQLISWPAEGVSPRCMGHTHGWHTVIWHTVCSLTWHAGPKPACRGCLVPQDCLELLGPVSRLQMTDSFLWQLGQP